jgi:predicted nucleic acid-binding protein
MRVVSNTSPLSNLAIIGRLELLQRRYGLVHIPPAVGTELAVLTHAAGKQRIEAALAARWILVEELVGSPPALPFALDAGETAAIALAWQTRADLLLLDERRGREAARQLGLAVAGVLSELIHAKQAGWVPSLREEIARLRQEARFFVDAPIEQFILAQVGESAS